MRKRRVAGNSSSEDVAAKPKSLRAVDDNVLDLAQRHAEYTIGSASYKTPQNFLNDK